MQHPTDVSSPPLDAIRRRRRRLERQRPKSHYEEYLSNVNAPAAAGADLDTSSTSLTSQSGEFLSQDNLLRDSQRYTQPEMNTNTASGVVRHRTGSHDDRPMTSQAQTFMQQRGSWDGVKSPPPPQPTFGSVHDDSTRAISARRLRHEQRQTAAAAGALRDQPSSMRHDAHSNIATSSSSTNAVRHRFDQTGCRRTVAIASTKA